VVVLGVAEPPVAAELVTVIGDVVAIEAGDRRDHELALVGLLERVELGGQRGLGGRIDDVRRVDDRRGPALRELRLGLRGARQSEPDERKKGEQSAHQAALLATGKALSFAGKVKTSFILPIIMSSAAASPRL